jgi:hypothetical protein
MDKKEEELKTFSVYFIAPYMTRKDIKAKDTDDASCKLLLMDSSPSVTRI